MKIPSSVLRRRIPESRLPAFVSSAPIAVIYLGREPALAACILDHFDRLARVGWLDGSALDTTAPHVRSWVEEQYRSLGWAPLSVLPSGYFLFLDGNACRYEPGVLDPDRDHYSLAFGLAASALAFIVDGPNAGTDTLILVHTQAALRVWAAFDLVIADRAEATKGAAEELRAAFAELGLPPTASITQVERRYRVLAAEWHPARPGTPPPLHGRALKPQH